MLRALKSFIRKCKPRNYTPHLMAAPPSCLPQPKNQKPAVGIMRQSGKAPISRSDSGPTERMLSATMPLFFPNDSDEEEVDELGKHASYSKVHENKIEQKLGPYSINSLFFP